MSLTTGLHLNSLQLVYSNYPPPSSIYTHRLIWLATACIGTVYHSFQRANGLGSETAVSPVALWRSILSHGEVRRQSMSTKPPALTNRSIYLWAAKHLMRAKRLGKEGRRKWREESKWKAGILFSFPAVLLLGPGGEQCLTGITQIIHLYRDWESHGLARQKQHRKCGPSQTCLSLHPVRGIRPREKGAAWLHSTRLWKQQKHCL